MATNQESEIEHEELVMLVEALASAAHVRFDSERTNQLIHRSRQRVPDGAASDLPERVISRIAGRLGLNVDRIEASLDHLLSHVGPRQPALLTGPHGGIAVLEADGAKVRVQCAAFPDGTWLRSGELARHLGVGSPEDEVSALLLESDSPMGDLSMPGHPPGDVKTALRRLWALLSSEWEDIRAIVIYAVGAGLFTLTTPIAVQSLVNTVAFGTLLQPLVVMTLLVILGLGLFGALTALEVYVVELLQRRIVARVVGDLSHRVPRAEASALDRIYGPEQLNRFFDVFTIHKATAQLLLDGLDLVLKAGIGLLLLAFYHPFLLAFDVVLLLALGLVLFGLGRGGMSTAIVESKKKYRLAGWLEELARRPSLFKEPSSTRFARERADAYLRDFLSARASHFRVVMRQTVGALALYALSSGALLGLGGWLVMSGQLTLGQLVAAELVLTTVVTSFAKLGKHVESFYDLVAAVDKVGMLFDLPIERDGGEGDLAAPPKTGSSLEIRNASISIGQKAALRDIDLSLQSGARVAILGGSGSGKSMFGDLAFGLRPPTGGEVYLDGVHFDDLPLSVLRTRVAVARPDDVVLGSLLDNIRLGDVSIDATTSRRALEVACLSDVAHRLDDGIDTEIFPGGRPMTEAETARLSIARAVATRPSLLVIDGLLDMQDEAIRDDILEHLCDQSAPWTLIVLTRMEAVARRLPRCMRLDNGHTVDLQGVPS